MSHLPAGPGSATLVRTVAEAGSYIASVCFKHGPPRLTGIELEWLLRDPLEPTRRPELAALAEALGPHAPRTLDPRSPARTLPGGGAVTVEPGGQVEISSQPAVDMAKLINDVRRDVIELRRLLRPTGFELSDRAVLDDIPPLLLSTPRYSAMATAFDAISPAGRVMMCASAATQISIDLGEPDQAALRWRAAHALGPVLLAAFANSASPGRVSTRMAAWWQLDPERTRPSSAAPTDYVQRALDCQVLARRRPGTDDWLVRHPWTLRDWIASGEPLTTQDIGLHLSMLFPPVRPQGYLELRYLDAQPHDEWIATLALVSGLFAGDLAEVVEICAPAADRWLQATDCGLADPVLATTARQLAAVFRPPPMQPSDQQEVLRLVERRLVQGISPADERERARTPAGAEEVHEEGTFGS